ncbi:MAG TPA: protein kinase [Myxococcota bacterium]|nr:protein kinase [Myxococcota bacterium]
MDPVGAQVPRVLAGRYELLAQIGRGAMGTVFRALDRETGRVVGLKALHGSDPDDLYRLKNEFRSLSRIAHPNLLRLYEMVVDGGHAFFTMEYVDGAVSLDEHVRRAGARALPDAADGVRQATLREGFHQLASALSALHEEGKIHRDLKPSNVLVDARGRVVLLDFGLVADVGSELALRSQVGSFVGTLAYMAPEQALGRPLAPAADWYSFGILLYECLTGRSPFDGAAPADLVDRSRVAVPSPTSVAPGCPADLARLATRLLALDAASRPCGADVLAALASAPADAEATATRPRTGSFVGRHGELEQLRRLHRRAGRGEPAVAVVQGASGIGKTALLECFADELAAEGVLVLRARCYPDERVSFEALDQAVDELSRYLASLPAERREALAPRHAAALCTVFPVLGRVLPDGGADALSGVEPHDVRRRAFLALRDLFARVADRRPLAVWVDDLQWADPDSEPLLEDLLRPPDAPPILWLLSYRSEDRAESGLLRGLEKLVDAAFEANRAAILLGPLSVPECAELAREVAAAPLEGDRLEALAAESGGSPFLLSELLRGDAAPLLTAPFGLVAAVGARLRALPEPARRLLESLAVAGGRLERAVALAAAGIEAADRDLLRRLEHGRLLRALAADVQGRVEIYHDQIREAIDAQLAPAERQARHAALAQSLERAGSGDVAALFEHWRGAGDRQRAAHYALLAGDQAAEQLAFDQAARSYAAALELDPAGAGGRPTLERLADARANAGRGGQAAEAFEAAARAASGTPAQADALQRRAAEQYLVSGHVTEGIRALQPLLSARGVPFPTSSRAAIAGTLAQLPALALYYAAFRPGRGAQDDERALRIEACQSAAKGLVVVDPMLGAWFAVRSLVDALRSRDAVRAVGSLCVVGTSLVSAGGPLAVWGRAMLRRAERLAAASGDPYHLAVVAISRAQEDFVDGRFTSMLERCDRGASLLAERCRGTRWERDLANMAAIRALEELGRVGELEARLPALLSEAVALDDLYASVTFRLYTAFWKIARGEIAEARRSAREAVERWGSRTFQLQHLYEVRIQVYCDLYEGEAEQGVERLRAAWPALARSGLLRHRMLRRDALILRARAALAAAGARDAPQRLLRDAARTARALGRAAHPPSETATSQLFRAAVAHRRGDDAAALALLEGAETGYAAASMALHAVYARRRRGQLMQGEAGRRLVDDADDALASAGIRTPAAWLAVQAPGFTSREAPASG